MKRIIALTLTFILALSCAAFAEGELLASTMVVNASDAMLGNIDCAVAALNGRTIQPGVPFSFNQTVGPRTHQVGYEVAVNGNGYDKLGGGVSQVATTLHNALIKASGVTFSQKHTYGDLFCAGYAMSGAEAILTDYENGYDLEFTSPNAYAISMWRSGNYLYCELKEPAPEPTTEPLKKMKVVNCQSYVNLRAEATAKSESLAQLTLGTEVEATGNVSGGFVEVIYMGMQGFVAEDYLAEQK